MTFSANQISRSMVPSIQQMNGAFLQAVTVSKADRRAHFAEATFFFFLVGRWAKTCAESNKKKGQTNR